METLGGLVVYSRILIFSYPFIQWFNTFCRQLLSRWWECMLSQIPNLNSLFLPQVTNLSVPSLKSFP